MDSDAINESPSRSRYGRTRKPKISEDFCNIDELFACRPSPKKSPQKNKIINEVEEIACEDIFTNAPKQIQPLEIHEIIKEDKPRAPERHLKTRKFFKTPMEDRQNINLAKTDSVTTHESDVDTIIDNLEAEIDVSKVMKLVATKLDTPQPRCDAKTQKPILKTYANRRKHSLKPIIESFALPDLPIVPNEPPLVISKPIQDIDLEIKDAAEETLLCTIENDTNQNLDLEADMKLAEIESKIIVTMKDSFKDMNFSSTSCFVKESVKPQKANDDYCSKIKPNQSSTLSKLKTTRSTFNEEFEKKFMYDYPRKVGENVNKTNQKLEETKLNVLKSSPNTNQKVTVSSINILSSNSKEIGPIRKVFPSSSTIISSNKTFPKIKEYRYSGRNQQKSALFVDKNNTSVSRSLEKGENVQNVEATTSPNVDKIATPKVYDKQKSNCPKATNMENTKTILKVETTPKVEVKRLSRSQTASNLVESLIKLKDKSTNEQNKVHNKNVLNEENMNKVNVKRISKSRAVINLIDIAASKANKIDSSNEKTTAFIKNIPNEETSPKDQVQRMSRSRSAICLGSSIQEKILLKSPLTDNIDGTKITNENKNILIKKKVSKIENKISRSQAVINNIETPVKDNSLLKLQAKKNSAKMIEEDNFPVVNMKRLSRSQTALSLNTTTIRERKLLRSQSTPKLESTKFIKELSVTKSKKVFTKSPRKSLRNMSAEPIGASISQGKQSSKSLKINTKSIELLESIPKSVKKNDKEIWTPTLSTSIISNNAKSSLMRSTRSRWNSLSSFEEISSSSANTSPVKFKQDCVVIMNMLSPEVMQKSLTGSFDTRDNKSCDAIYSPNKKSNKEILAMNNKSDKNANVSRCIEEKLASKEGAVKKPLIVRRSQRNSLPLDDNTSKLSPTKPVSKSPIKKEIVKEIMTTQANLLEANDKLESTISKSFKHPVECVKEVIVPKLRNKVINTVVQLDVSEVHSSTLVVANIPLESDSKNNKISSKETLPENSNDSIEIMETSSKDSKSPMNKVTCKEFISKDVQVPEMIENIDNFNIIKKSVNDVEIANSQFDGRSPKKEVQPYEVTVNLMQAPTITNKPVSTNKKESQDAKLFDVLKFESPIKMLDKLPRNNVDDISESYNLDDVSKQDSISKNFGNKVTRRSSEDKNQKDLTLTNMSKSPKIISHTELTPNVLQVSIKQKCISIGHSGKLPLHNKSPKKTNENELLTGKYKKGDQQLPTVLSSTNNSDNMVDKTDSVLDRIINEADGSKYEMPVITSREVALETSFVENTSENSNKLVTNVSEKAGLRNLEKLQVDKRDIKQLEPKSDSLSITVKESHTNANESIINANVPVKETTAIDVNASSMNIPIPTDTASNTDKKKDIDSNMTTCDMVEGDNNINNKLVKVSESPIVVRPTRATRNIERLNKLKIRKDTSQIDETSYSKKRRPLTLQDVSPKSINRRNKSVDINKTFPTVAMLAPRKWSDRRKSVPVNYNEDAFDFELLDDETNNTISLDPVPHISTKIEVKKINRLEKDQKTVKETIVKETRVKQIMKKLPSKVKVLSNETLEDEISMAPKLLVKKPGTSWGLLGDIMDDVEYIKNATACLTSNEETCTNKDTLTNSNQPENKDHEVTSEQNKNLRLTPISLCLSKTEATPKKLKGCGGHWKTYDMKDNSDVKLLTGENKELVQENDIEIKSKTSILEENYVCKDNEDGSETPINALAGELLWARLGTHPYWPCLCIEEPTSRKFKKLLGYKNKIVWSYHVRFFGDRGRRAWIHDKLLLIYKNEDDLDKLKTKLITKKSTNKFKINACLISKSKKAKWDEGVREAQLLKSKSVDERFNFFKSFAPNIKERDFAHKHKILDLEKKRKQDILVDIKEDASHSKRKKYRSLEENEPIAENSFVDEDLELIREGERLRKDNQLLDSIASRGRHLRSSLGVLPQNEANEKDITNKIRGIDDTRQKRSLDNEDSKVDVKKSRSTGLGMELHKKRTLQSLGKLEFNKERTPLREASRSMLNDLTSECSLSDTDSSSRWSIKTPTNESQELLFKRNNLFKGISKDRVCLICKKADGNIFKCKGKCLGTFHSECSKSLPKIKVPKITENDVQIIRIKDKKFPSPKKLELNTDLQFKSLSLMEQLDFKLQEVMKPIASKTIYADSTTDSSSEDSSSEKTICTSTENTRMIVKHVTADDIELTNIIKPQKIYRRKSSIKPIYDESKCKNCNEDKDPICFVCNLEIGWKDSHVRQKCSLNSCGRFYHPECLKVWPQTQFSITSSANSEDSFICPSHVCHICVSDDPRASNSRSIKDKVVRCVECPATYHGINYCIPAGTKILSTTQIICPRHFSKQTSKKKKKHATINTTWCFICSEGGDLICCETCPTSVHSDCSSINLMNDGTFICEDCETGRFPLYDEIVWVKLGSYRWWPALILFPNEVPDNLVKYDHNEGEFVVKFFGTNDHYWVGRGRCFLFQEGDHGQGNTVKKRVDAVFLEAIEEATIAHAHKKVFKENKASEIRSCLKPPPYQKIKVNRPVGNVKQFDGNISNTTPCNCDPKSRTPCGPDTDCINRLLLTECDPEVCPAQHRCKNQRFEKREYPPLVPYLTNARGWGLKSLVPIDKGQFVIEYVGELIDDDEYLRRIARMHEKKEDNYYFLSIENDRMIDAGPKGNVARFMNHCCQPNCETQKWNVKGDTRVGLFAAEDIPANVELTFNYNLECVGEDKKICKCGAANCSGFIGAKVKNNDEKKTRKCVTKTKNKKKRSPTPSVPISSIEPCFICSTKTGKLIPCSNKICPKYYHLKCINFNTVPEGKWTCPWHNCNTCAKRTIRCCVKCTNSYCPLHSEGNVRYDKLLGFVCTEHDPSKEAFMESKRTSTAGRKSKIETTEADVTSTTCDEMEINEEFEVISKQRTKTSIEGIGDEIETVENIPDSLKSDSNLIQPKKQSPDTIKKAISSVKSSSQSVEINKSASGNSDSSSNSAAELHLNNQNTISSDATSIQRTPDAKRQRGRPRTSHLKSASQTHHTSQTQQSTGATFQSAEVSSVDDEDSLPTSSLPERHIRVKRKETDDDHKKVPTKRQRN